MAAVLADVSMKMRPCSRAKASPSSLFTSRLASRSLSYKTWTQLKYEHKFQFSFDTYIYNFLNWILQKKLPFVADEHDNHITITMLTRIFEPSCQVVECISSVNTSNEHNISSFLSQTINPAIPAFYGVEKRCNVQMCYSYYIRPFDICTFNTKWSIS